MQEGQTNGRLNPKSLEKLKQLIQRDYSVALTDEEAEALGISMLKITRLAMSAFNREEAKRSMAST